MKNEFFTFIQLLGYDDGIAHKMAVLFDSLVGDRKIFAQFLAEECDCDESVLNRLFKANFDDDDLALNGWVVSYLFDSLLVYYRDDYKIDYDYLNKYISEQIGQKFHASYDEYTKIHQQNNQFNRFSDDFITDFNYICHKLENESEFTLLHIFSGDDDVNYFVVDKTAKPKLLALADELGLVVE
ncbi:DUF6630 family protein [Moraxella oblonga]|uniref:DUF6630 family protein n=1 Tax=Moraxella oblonga TaxID=200413 RepID=UPI00082B7795|nr:hypothetical protein [Moraxella oblonga]